MKPESSKLARLVVAYYEEFGHHVPEAASRQVDSEELAARIQESLANRVPISEAGWGWGSEMEFGPRGCIRREERTTLTKGFDGEWLQ